MKYLPGGEISPNKTPFKFEGHLSTRFYLEILMWLFLCIELDINAFVSLLFKLEKITKSRGVYPILLWLEQSGESDSCVSLMNANCTKTCVL